MSADPLQALTWGIAAVLLSFWALRPESGWVARFRRARRLDERVLCEDALKFLYRRESEGQAATVQGVAGALGVSGDRAAELVATMEDRELLTAGAVMRLTPQGRNHALQVVRAHRLWEAWLADRTGYDAAEWHARADRKEHQFQAADLDQLAARLGNPPYDPHGDPIPTADLEVAPPLGQPIVSVRPGCQARIVHLEDEPQAAYAQLLAEGLRPGMAVRLLESVPGRVRLWSEEGEHVLAPVVAANLWAVALDEGCFEDAGLPLSSLAAGQEARVLALSRRLRTSERRRLMDLGLLPGATVRVELVAPLGDPVGYRVRGALVALRREQTEGIRVAAGIGQGRALVALRREQAEGIRVAAGIGQGRALDPPPGASTEGVTTGPDARRVAPGPFRGPGAGLPEARPQGSKAGPEPAGEGEIP